MCCWLVAGAWADGGGVLSCWQVYGCVVDFGSWRGSQDRTGCGLPVMVDGRSSLVGMCSPVGMEAWVGVGVGVGWLLLSCVGEACSLVWPVL